MSSKSANYCDPYTTGGNALLLLCEAELGDPMQVLTDAQYDAGTTAKEKGVYSTWGQGQIGPKAWKDAKCLHPSLAGVKMVRISLLHRRGGGTDMSRSPIRLRSRPRPTSKGRTCSITNTSATTWLRYAYATCCAFVCEAQGTTHDQVPFGCFCLIALLARSGH